MNKNLNGILPVGTVVKLKDADKNLMITGFFPVSTEKNKIFDYTACLYPEGIISSEVNMVFDNNQIEKILYMGYMSDEEKSFKITLNEIMLKNRPAIEQSLKDGVMPTSNVSNSTSSLNAIPTNTSLNQINNNLLFNNNNNPNA